MRPDCEREYVEYVTARLPKLHRAAYLLCGDPHRAEDIVQSTALAVYLKWRRVRAADNIDGYVHRMLVRQYLDQQRLGWWRVLLMDRPPERAAPPPPGIEERDAVTAALARVAPGQRAVLVLRFFCDLSVEATAAALGCSTGTVKSQTARGLATLRRLLAPTGPAPVLAAKGEADDA